MVEKSKKAPADRPGRKKKSTPLLEYIDPLFFGKTYHCCWWEVCGLDKYQKSFLSGVLAGVILDIFDYISYFIQKLFHIKHITYPNYMAAALLQGKPARNVFEFLSGQFFHLVFTGCIGCVYIFILTSIREKNTAFKGWLIGGIGTWFFTFMIGVLYKIELFVAAEMNTVISNFITASIFGIAI